MKSSREEEFDQDVLRSVREGKHSLEWALRCGGVGVFLECRNGEVHTTALTREWFSFPSDSPVTTAEQFFCGIHPEDVEYVAKARQGILDNASHFQLKCRVIDAEGQIRWLQIEGDGGEPGSDLVAACTVRDITEQQELEHRLQHTSERLTTALEAGPVVVWEFDMQTMLYDMSENVQVLLGYPASRLDSFQSFLELLHPDDVDEVLRYLGQYKEGQVTEHNLLIRLQHADRGYRWIKSLGHVMRRDDNGNPTHIGGSMQDVSQEQKMMKEMEEAHSQLAELLQTDMLTGLYTRRHCEASMEEHCVEATRYKVPLSCLMLDLDHFKDINDTFGHDMGDIVLREVAGILLANARDADMVVRYGGEEFVILLPHTPGQGAKVIADRLCQAVADHAFQSIPDKRRLTISIGVCSASGEGPVVAHELAKQADQAMYQSKRKGRNQVTCVQM